MDVLALLRSKNRCLEQFLKASEEFRARSAAQSDALLDSSALEGFQNRRDDMLRAIDLYDRKIQDTVRTLPEYMKQVPALVEAVRSALERKEELVKKILHADLEIISRIEETKNQLLRDLQDTKKSKETLGKFKSTWMPKAGEELDRKL